MCMNAIKTSYVASFCARNRAFLIIKKNVIIIPLKDATLLANFSPCGKMFNSLLE